MSDSPFKAQLTALPQSLTRDKITNQRTQLNSAAKRSNGRQPSRNGRKISAQTAGNYLTEHNEDEGLYPVHHKYWQETMEAAVAKEAAAQAGKNQE